MTRRDYIAISAAITAERASVDRNVPPAHRLDCHGTLDTLAIRLAEIMAADNGRFDRDRFLTAAGVK